MGRYATWGRCLDCQAEIGSATACPNCGLVQISAEANLLRWHLVEAERALIAARQPAAQPTAPPTSYWPPPLRGLRPPSARPLRTAPSTSTVLLGLGAVCLVVAAIVFVSVQWSSLSIAAKSAILLGVTAVFGGLTWWGLRRGLRGSAETFSCVFVVLAAIDFAAAREGGLIDGVSDVQAEWITTGILVAAGAGWAWRAVRTRVGQLTGAQVLASLGLLSFCLLAFNRGWTRAEYVAFGLTALLAVVAFAAARIALWTLAMGALSVAAVMVLTAYVVSLYRVLPEWTFHDLWSTGKAAGWAVCIVLAALVASARVVPLAPRRLSASVATVGLALLLLLPMASQSTDELLAAFAAVAVALALLAVISNPVWLTGMRVALVPISASVLILAWPAIALAAARVVVPAFEPWQHDYGRRTHIAREIVDIHSYPLAAGLALFATLIAVVLAQRLRLPSAWSLILLATPCAGVAALGRAWPLWGVVVVVAMLALVAGVVALAAESQTASWVAAGYTVLVLVAAAGSAVTTAVAAAGVCAVLAGVSVWADDDVAAAGSAGGSVVFGGLAVTAALAVRDLTDSTTPYALVGLAAAVVLGAQLRFDGAPLRARIGLEAGAVLAGAAGIALAEDDPAVRLPICLTVAGAALVAVGLVRADRSLAKLAGGLMLVAATWSRLLSQDVGTVEWYTMPTAVVLCAIGVWRMQTRPDASTVFSLSPGLVLLLLPSLIATLPDPTSLRALLLGIGSLAVLLVGAVLRWAAPLIVASVTLLVLAVVNLAPYANAVPRWVLFGLAGAGLLYLGVTWERRLRNARSLIMAVELLR